MNKAGMDLQCGFLKPQLEDLRRSIFKPQLWMETSAKSNLSWSWIVLPSCYCQSEEWNFMFNYYSRHWQYGWNINVLLRQTYGPKFEKENFELGFSAADQTKSENFPLFILLCLWKQHPVTKVKQVLFIEHLSVQETESIPTSVTRHSVLCNVSIVLSAWLPQKLQYEVLI